MTSETDSNHCKQRFFFLFSLILGFGFGLGSLGLGVASMADCRWIYYSVNNSYALSNDTITSFTRYRGMFLECVEDGQQGKMTSGLLNTMKFGTCLSLDLGENHPTTENWNYAYIINLRRAHIGTFSAALFSVIVALLVSLGAFITWCLSRHGVVAYRVISVSAGILFIVGTFCYIASVLILHVVLDEEKMRNTNNLASRFYYSWSSDTRIATTMSYVVMYYLAWGACGASLIAALLFFLSNCCYHRSSRLGSSVKDDKRRLNGEDNPSYTTGSDFMAMKETTAPTIHDDGQWSTASGNQRKLPRYPADGGGGGGQQQYMPQDGMASSKNVYRIY